MRALSEFQESSLMRKKCQVRLDNNHFQDKTTAFISTLEILKRKEI